MGSMNKKTMALLATAEVTGEQLSWLTGEQLSWLTGEQLSSLTGEQLSSLTREQLSSLTRGQFSWLTGEQLSWLTREQLSSLTGGQLSWLTGGQLSSLTGGQLSWLTREQLSSLTRGQLSSLTGGQLSWLTGEQLSILQLENVPMVPDLYTQILTHIKEDDWNLNQGTWGQSNRGKSVCDSPMCIGGSTVYLAGDEGYKLADRFGYAIAALLIHRKSRPDTGAPRYDNYPNGWALAYIEERAKEEKKMQESV